MRARVRCWWHIRRQQIQLAILENDLHLRSFAEFAICGSRPRPDTAGITSRIGRFLLGRFTQAHPLCIDLPVGADEAKGTNGHDGSIHWKSPVTGYLYQKVLPRPEKVALTNAARISALTSLNLPK